MLPLTEPFTRFIYREEHILDNNKVAAAAFTPFPGDGKTSLWYIAGVTEFQITERGKEIGARRRTLLGRADLVAGTVYNQGLDIELDMSRSRHANISGWPPDKEERLEIALHLALGSTLQLVS